MWWVQKSEFLANSSCVPLQWLFQYPVLRLNRLELFFEGSFYIQLLNLQTFSGSLSACPHDIIETLCITFSSIGHGITSEDVPALLKILQLCSIAELGFSRCACYSDEDGLLSILRDVFSRGHLSSLQRFLLSNPIIFHRGQHYDSQISLELTDSIPPQLSHFWLLFDALFSMRKEQLAEFTLDLSNNIFDPPQQQEIVEALKQVLIFGGYINCWKIPFVQRHLRKPWYSPYSKKC